MLFIIIKISVSKIIHIISKPQFGMERMTIIGGKINTKNITVSCMKKREIDEDI